MPSPAEEASLPPLIVIVGPTAAGKTALAVRLARDVGGEIVSADSRQVYRGMDVGTAKATPQEQALVPHHLIDVVDPDETLGLAQFQEMAYAAIDDVLARARVPFLVGGTGQYVMAVVEGWRVPRVPPDEVLRRDLYRQAKEEGAEALHNRLRTLDPGAAERIDPRNVRRVIRALEVCLTTGRPISEQQGKSPPPYRILMIGLTMARPQLYQRIDERVERMIEAGLEDEVRRLLAEGYGFELPAMSGVGYGQFAPYMTGEAALVDVVREIKRATRRFVRHQSNWFRRDDPRICWFDTMPDPYDAALDLICEFLSRGKTPVAPESIQDGRHSQGSCRHSPGRRSPKAEPAQRLEASHLRSSIACIPIGGKTTMHVRIIGVTSFAQNDSAPEALLEHAGRTCYRSEPKGEPGKFLRARIREGHESIIEHASVTFEISGISRACSHQLVRHRIASYSQESQRYVGMSAPEFVVPPSVAENPQAVAIWDEFMGQVTKAYHRLRELGVRKEDARFVLPNAAATRIIVTMNFRSLRHFFSVRCDRAAQWEIRDLALEMLRQVHVLAPSVFGDLYDRFLQE